jgi:predicted RNase H-like nuclease (RuvC/YqgF family)
VGAAVGGGIGAAVGGGLEHGMIGAALGGAAGLVIGNEIARRKQQYADWNELLDAEIADTGRANRALAERNEQLRRELAELNRRVAELEAAVAAGRTSSADKERERRAVRERVAAAEAALTDAQTDLEVRRALLAEAREQAEVDRDGLRAYGAEVAEMERRVAELGGLVERYASVGAVAAAS